MQQLACSFLLSNARGAGCQTRSLPSLGHVVIHPTIAWPSFNWALPDSAEAIAGLTAALAEADRRPTFAIPFGSPLEQELAARQFKPGPAHYVYLAQTGEVVSPLPVPPGGVQVVPAADPHAWLDLLLDGFEVPENLKEPFQAAHAPLFGRMIMLEALVDGQRAGAAGLWLEQGIAGMNTASVLPALRRRGVHGALFAARVARGQELGALCFATETGEEPVRLVAGRFGLKQALCYRFWH